MDYSKRIESVKARIEELTKIEEVLDQIEETVCAIEKEISDLDNSLPSDRDIRKMKPGPEKDRLNELLDLISKSYGIIDEILGPPDQQAPGAPTRFLS